MSNSLLKDFLAGFSGKTSDDIIASLSVEQIKVLMSLPTFDLEDGLDDTVLNVDETLNVKGHDISDTVVNELFKKKYLNHVKEGKTFSVCEPLRGKDCKNAIVKRYIDLRRGGDGSELFNGLFGE